MLLPRISIGGELKKLVEDVRLERKKMSVMCPAAEDDVDINAILREVVDKRFYEKDYEVITSYFQNDRLAYDEAVSVIEKIIESNVYAK
jgi:hypothetical protein